MARTKQTARKSMGGKAPRKTLGKSEKAKTPAVAKKYYFLSKKCQKLDPKTFLQQKF